MMRLQRSAAPAAACSALALALALGPGARRAGAESGPAYRGVFSEAMGDAGIASSSGVQALFLNPGRLGADSGRISGGLSASLGLNAVLLDYAHWAADNAQYLNNLDSMLARVGPVDNRWAPFSQYLSLYTQYHAFTFAMVEDIRYDLTVSKAVVTPVLGVGALSDLTIIGGRAFSVPGDFSLGVAAKYIHRIRYDDRLIGLGDDDLYTVKHTLETPAHGIFAQLRKLEVASEVAQVEDGAGLNLGLSKRLGDSWEAGFAVADFPTILGGDFLRPRFNLGLGFHRDIHPPYELSHRLLVDADLQDFLLPGTPWFRQVKLGVAWQNFYLGRPVGYLALGVNDGYPTFGVSVGYFAFLTYTYTAAELGSAPGQEKLSFHKLTFDLAF